MIALLIIKSTKIICLIPYLLLKIKEFEKVKKLARQAFQNTDNEPIKSESSYLLGRVFHCQKNYEQAYQYYYQSVQFAPASYLLPHIGLAQMYIERKEFENALQSLAKVLKHHPENIQALKLQAYAYSQHQKDEKRDVAIVNLEKILKSNPNDVNSLISIAQFTESINYQVICLQNSTTAFFVKDI